jgi:hypothetical protein
MHIYFSFKKKMFSNKKIGGWEAIDWEAIVLGGLLSRELLS